MRFFRQLITVKVPISPKCRPPVPLEIKINENLLHNSKDKGLMYKDKREKDPRQCLHVGSERR